MWTVLFYIDEDGTCPVKDFLVNLDIKVQARFAWSIEQLQKRNVYAREPLAHHLEGRLWELQEETSSATYTIIFSYSGQRIVLLHGFQKETQKTPHQEIEIALKRFDNFVTREKVQQ